MRRAFPLSSIPLLFFLLAAAVLGQPALEADRTPPAPALHCAIQHVPRDGTGRFAGGTDILFRGTHMRSVVWPTHVFAWLFYKQTLDQYLPFRSLASAEELRQLVIQHADRCLDFAEEVLGGPPTEHLRIFVDLEKDTIGRWPYVDTVPGEEYAARTMQMMNLLCGQIVSRGQARWGVRVSAGTYNTVRHLGDWAGLREVPEPFFTKWGGHAVAPLLDRNIQWIHCYLQEQESGFARAGQTWENYAYHQIKYQIEQVEANGGAPDEYWIFEWIYTEPSYEEMLAFFTAVDRVRSEYDGPAVFHVAIAGGWHTINHLVDVPVSKVSVNPEPLRLSLDGMLVGTAFANMWNETVVEAYEAAFKQTPVMSN